MFDIGFWELSLIMVVALLVIGPERLPGVARKAGLWVNKGRGFIRSIKADIEQEIAADELKKVLKDHAKLPGVHEIIEETRDEINNTASDIASSTDSSAEKESKNNPKDTSSEESVPEVIGHSSEGSLDKLSNKSSGTISSKSNSEISSKSNEA